MVARDFRASVLLCFGALLLAACNSESKGPVKPADRPTEAVAPAESAKLAGPPQQAAHQKPAAPKPTPLKLVDISPIAIDPNLSFAELSQRFAAARADIKIMPSGAPELWLLYREIGRLGFRGSQGSEGLHEQLHAWIADQPKEPAPLVTLIDIRLERAWAARGMGPASTVSPAQFTKFRENLQEAKQFAERALALGVNDPELYSHLIKIGVGLGQDRATVEAWSKKTVAEFPLYFPVYESMSTYLLPRWHGEPGDVEAYAKSLFTAIPGDDGLEAFSRVIMGVSTVDRQFLHFGNVPQEEILRGVKLLQQRYPNARLFLDYRAHVAWRNLDYAQCAALAPALRDLEKNKKHSMQPWGHEKRYQQFLLFSEARPAPDQPEKTFWPHPTGASSIVFVGDAETLVAGGYAPPNTLNVFELADLTRPAAMIPLPGGYYHLRIDRLGRYLIACGMGTGDSAIVIDLAAPNKPPVIYQPPAKKALDWGLAADGSLAVVMCDGFAETWDPATGKAIRRIEPLKHMHVGQEYGLLSVDGQRLAVNAEDGYEIRNTSDGQVMHKFSVLGRENPGEQGLQNVIGFDPGGALLCLGRSSVNGRYQFSLYRHDLATNKITNIADVTPQSRLVAAHSDKFVIMSDINHKAGRHVLTIYDQNTGKPLRRIDGHPRPPAFVAVSPDGSKLATVDDTGVGRIWPMPKPDSRP